MNKIILKILNFILKFQEQKFAKKARELKAPDSLRSENSTSKTYLNAHETLSISTKTDADRKKLDKRIREVVKNNIKTPEKLLEFMENSGTKIYKIKFADKILSVINESEGLILPLKGFRALYLNIILNKKFDFETKEMFVSRDMPLNIYVMSHQFHKWYGFKMNLSGFEERAVELFRQIEELGKPENIKNLNYSDIMSLKEALRRDIEAIDFVVNLSRESEGAKSALKNIKEGNGANI